VAARPGARPDRERRRAGRRAGAAGLEVEQVHRYGDDVSGVVTGQVLDVEELTGFKKPIRYCHVDVGARVHEVVCGATNFAAGDRVAFALPGRCCPAASPSPPARRTATPPTG
jgi:phenylalanyl-tRNA synthetase beta chain